MKKKKLLFICGMVFALILTLNVPQMTSIAFAKPMPVFNQGDIIDGEFIVTEKELGFDKETTAYLGFYTYEINVIRKIDGQIILEFDSHTLSGKKLRDWGGLRCSVDIYNGLYRADYANRDWQPINRDARSFVDPHPENDDVSITVNVFIDYVKNNMPDVYNEIMLSGRAAEEKVEATERARLMLKLDTAYQYAENDVTLFPQYGKQIDWVDFTEESVDYSKSPALSELIGHVFQLTDKYGFRTQRGDKGVPVIKTDQRKSALVHFTILQNADGKYQIALMDDTGDFVGPNNINRMPLMTDFKAYQEEFGYYTGTNDVFHRTGSFNSMGEVIGFPNLQNGLVSDGFVKVGLEKTDEAGTYHLVYYVTKESFDSYGGRSKASTKHDGYYATLTLVK